MSILGIDRGPLAEESLQRLHTHTCVQLVRTCGATPLPPEFNASTTDRQRKNLIATLAHAHILTCKHALQLLGFYVAMADGKRGRVRS